MEDPSRKLLWVLPKQEQFLMEQVKKHHLKTKAPSANIITYATPEFLTITSVADLTHWMITTIIPALKRDIFQYVVCLVPDEREYLHSSMKMLEVLTEDVDMTDIMTTRFIGILPHHQRQDHYVRYPPKLAEGADDLIVGAL